MRKETNNTVKLNSSEKNFFILFSVIWTASPFLDLLRGLFLHIPGLSAFSDYVAPTLVYFAIALALKYVIKNIKVKDFVLILIIVLFYFLNFAVYPNNREVLAHYSFIFLCTVLPYYLIGTLLDINKFYYYIGYLSRFVIVLQFFYVFIYGADIKATKGLTDSMVQAYAVLPHLLIVIHLFVRERKLLDVLFVIIGLIQIFSFGNRGAMAALIIFVFLSILQLPNSQLSKFWKSVITVILGIIYFFTKEIALFFEVIIANLGMSTRIFTMLLEDSFLQDDSRMEDYWKPLLNIVRDAPVTGYGIGGDRVVGDVVYAHNILIEFLVSFGILFGSLLFLIICLHLLRGILLNHDDNTRSIILVLICSSFFPLFVTGTYLSASFFFLLLGICTRSIRLRNKQAKYSLYE